MHSLVGGHMHDLAKIASHRQLQETTGCSLHIRYNFSVQLFITGSIARSANLPVFSLLRGRFWGFSPRRGDTLHRWGWNDKGVGPQKLKFLLRFDQNVEYKRPAGAYPLRDFHKICRICTPFQDALAVKINFVGFAQGVTELWGF